MKSKKNQEIERLIKFLREPRKIKEIKKEFKNKRLKEYLQEIEKEYQVIRTEDKKIFLIKKDDPIEHSFKIIEVVDEDRNLTKNATLIVFPKKWNKVRIVPMADIYFGDPLLNSKKLKKHIEWISRDEHVFTFFNGNCFSLLSPQNFNKVFEEFKKIFYPIRKKILFIVNGPNEKRIEKNKKICLNPLKILAEENKIPFFEDQAHVTFSFENSNKYLKLFALHGKSNAINLGAKINAAARVLSFVDTDIVIISNLKQATVKKLKIFYVNPEKENIEEKKLYLIILSSFLNYIGSEEAMKGYPPPYEGQINIAFYRHARYSQEGDFHVYGGSLKEKEEVILK